MLPWYVVANLVAPPPQGHPEDVPAHPWLASGGPSTPTLLQPQHTGPDSPGACWWGVQGCASRSSVAKAERLSSIQFEHFFMFTFMFICNHQKPSVKASHRNLINRITRSLLSHRRMPGVCGTHFENHYSVPTPHSADENTKVQRGKLICPRSLSN